MHFFLFVLFAVVPEAALATDTPIGNVLCTVTGWFTGNTGKGLATIAVVIIGIWRLQGKWSGPRTLMCLTGIAIIFAAAHLVETMNAGAGSGCETNAIFYPPP
ncbi:MAG: hypothetical protein EBR02_04060 [Alphaproteobacteria bacterium]|nr:hypothetical protein [Alphaproteobacteria bacterium]